MQSIFTIGTQGRHDDEFIAALMERQIDAVIDIRLHNEGRYYRFASGKHIKRLCAANSIFYRHETRFAPSGDMLSRFREGQDWPAYARAYRELSEERNMLDLWRTIAAAFRRPCLLCAEKKPDTCHRGLLAEAICRDLECTIAHIVD
jgi:uncharacterized protein (DUF488 family)